MADFLQRIRKEARITFETFRESVIAIAERVNRKIQILMLHWRASAIHERIDVVHHDLGNRLCDLLSQSRETASSSAVVAGTDPEGVVLEAIGRIRLLKYDLVDIDRMARELEIETLREDLMSLQHDLSTRSALIRRVVIESGAVANGRSLLQLGLPSTVRVAAILRGPLLLAVSDQVELRSGDIVVLLGSRADLQQSLPFFSHSARAFT